MDPATLGEVLVKITGMTNPPAVSLPALSLSKVSNPPKQFYAGSETAVVITPALDARLQEIKDHEALSKSTDGSF